MATKKKPSDGIYQKVEKPKKETVFILETKYDPKVETREVIEKVRRYGKNYIKLKNN